jgi:hypothetical protein
LALGCWSFMILGRYGTIIESFTTAREVRGIRETRHLWYVTASGNDDPEVDRDLVTLAFAPRSSRRDPASAGPRQRASRTGRPAASSGSGLRIE